MMEKDLQRLNGSKDLIFDAIEETTNLVERMQALVVNKTIRSFTIAEPLSIIAKTVKAVHAVNAAVVYESIRIVNRGVQKILDLGAKAAAAAISVEKMEQAGLATPMRSDAKGSPSWVADHAESALNALFGDYLANKQNALDLGMSFRHHGHILPLAREILKEQFPAGGGKVCVFVHGLGCTEWTWCISAQRFYGDPAANFGELLKKDLGYTPLFVRYNTGRHVSENGRRLSDLLARLADAYPFHIEEIVLVGHSMGGLVARSAAHYARRANAPWVDRLRHIFCIGSPNLGAPLEKATNMLGSLLRNINTVGTQVPARVLNSRSSGIKDLRFGYTLDDEWDGKDPDAFLDDNRLDAAFVDGVTYCYIAATITADPDHPLGVLLGDLLVRVPSASGQAAISERRIPFNSGFVFNGMNHMHLANHPDVYAVIRQQLTQASSTAHFA
jgi:pimeloyl-ACP methyl ester carboxylesterase